MSEELGLILGKLIANANKPSGSIIELKTSPQVDATCIEAALQEVVTAIRVQAEKKNGTAEATLAVRAAILSLAEYMPQGADYAALATAISALEIPEIVDLTPAIKEMVLALDRNTEAVKEQTAVLKMDKNLSYDRDGKIIRVTVGK